MCKHWSALGIDRGSPVHNEIKLVSIDFVVYEPYHMSCVALKSCEKPKAIDIAIAFKDYCKPGNFGDRKLNQMSVYRQIHTSNFGKIFSNP